MKWDLTYLGGSDQILHCKGRSLTSSESLVISLIYGSNTKVQRMKLWKEIVDIGAGMGDP